MARAYQHVSADSHFEAPPDLWRHRIPEKYRDRASQKDPAAQRP